MIGSLQIDNFVHILFMDFHNPLDIVVHHFLIDGMT